MPSAEEPMPAAPALHLSRWQATAVLSWRLFLRDLSARYRHSLLGLLWAVITPLFLVGLLVALNRSGVIRTTGSDALPPVVFAITGVTIWGIFSTGVSAAAECLNTAGSTMLRMNFPRASLILAAVGMGIFEFLIRLPVALCVWWWYGFETTAAGFVLGIASLLPLLLLTLALGMAAAVASVMVRDVIHLIPIVLSLLMLVSPVLYSLPPESLLGRVNEFNPVSHFLITARGLFAGQLHASAGYWLSSLASVVLLAMAWRLFRVAQPKVLERM